MHMMTRMVEHLLSDTARAMDGVFSEVVEDVAIRGRVERAMRCNVHTGVDRVNAALKQWSCAGDTRVTFSTTGRQGTPL